MVRLIAACEVYVAKSGSTVCPNHSRYTSNPAISIDGKRVVFICDFCEIETKLATPKPKPWWQKSWYDVFGK